MKEPEETAIDENETKTEEELQTEEDGAEYEESPKKKLNTSLESVGVSHINFHAVPQYSRVTRAKDKLKSVMEKYQKSISDVCNIPADVSKYFHVSEYLVCTARELKKTSGILATSLTKKRKMLPQENVDLNVDLYKSDENSTQIWVKRTM